MTDTATSNIEYAGMVANRPTIWRALGFWSAHANRPADADASYVVHRVVTHWDWRDRLRILFSGRTDTEIYVEIEPEPITFLDGAASAYSPKIGKVRTGVAVLPPGRAR